jgi:hypothetical protein
MGIENSIPMMLGRNFMRPHTTIFSYDGFFSNAFCACEWPFCASFFSYHLA